MPLYWNRGLSENTVRPQESKNFQALETGGQFNRTWLYIILWPGYYWVFNNWFSFIMAIFVNVEITGQHVWQRCHMVFWPLEAFYGRGQSLWTTIKACGISSRNDLKTITAPLLSHGSILVSSWETKLRHGFAVTGEFPRTSPCKNGTTIKANCTRTEQHL